MEVRRATPGDAPAIAEVHIRSWQTGYRGQLPGEFLDGLDASLDRRIDGWAANAADPGMDVFVAVDRGRLVGFASASPGRDEDLPHHGELQTIYVLGEAWGRGVGSALITAATDALIERGYTAALLWVLDGNERTIRFYEHHRWARDGARRTEAWGEVDLHEVRMVCSL